MHKQKTLGVQRIRSTHTHSNLTVREINLAVEIGSAIKHYASPLSHLLIIMQQQIQRQERLKKKKKRAIVHETKQTRQRRIEREGRRAVSPGSAILTICEGLEAHLAAVFAKASHSPCTHLYHIDCTRPEGLHTRCVSLAPQDSGVNLCMVLKRATITGSKLEITS